MRHTLTFGGKNLTTFGVHISGEDTWKKPTADYEQVSVPGRNGDLLFFNNRYNNVAITYACGIVKDFDTNFTNLCDYLFSHSGYQRLEDSYHSDYYRMAFFNGELAPEMTRLNREGQFTLSFMAKPQMFLKSGETKTTLTASGYIKNPTPFAAKPLLRVYGTGQLGIGSQTITINKANTYTDIDCELQDAYKNNSSNNCNANITLSGDSFPTLGSGSVYIRLGTGITQVDITPRWWRL